MKILIIGSGGREHAIAWKVAQSPLVDGVFVAPGNPGTAATDGVANVNVVVSDHDAVAAFAAANDVGLVVIGPEAPLVAGLADSLRATGLSVVGPGADGAVLEGSKTFAKEVMDAAGVPTARWARVHSDADIDTFCDRFDGAALVVKADGLAAGKGVIVCDDVESARIAAKEMLRDRPFGEASASIVLEERLEGIETSYIVLASGSNYVALPTSQDHKRLQDGDRGPNTGGMGAFTPAPFVSDSMRAAFHEEVIEPVLAELAARGIDFRGFLYAGMMLTAAGPRVLEFNVRLGDPETQVLLSAIDEDIVPALVDCANGSLSTRTFSAAGAAAVIVLAAEGYPTKPVKGAPIEGIDAANSHAAVTVFHAGTRESGEAVCVNGGRVLGVTGRAATPDEAVRVAYEAAREISWPGLQMRSDIGKALSL